MCLITCCKWIPRGNDFINSCKDLSGVNKVNSELTNQFAWTRLCSETWSSPLSTHTCWCMSAGIRVIDITIKACAASTNFSSKPILSACFFFSARMQRSMKLSISVWQYCISGRKPVWGRDDSIYAPSSKSIQMMYNSAFRTYAKHLTEIPIFEADPL